MITLHVVIGFSVQPAIATLMLTPLGINLSGWVLILYLGMDSWSVLSIDESSRIFQEGYTLNKAALFCLIQLTETRGQKEKYGAADCLKRETTLTVFLQ